MVPHNIGTQIVATSRGHVNIARAQAICEAKLHPSTSLADLACNGPPATHKRNRRFVTVLCVEEAGRDLSPVLCVEEAPCHAYVCSSTKAQPE